MRNAFRQRDAKYRQQLWVFLVCLLISVFVWFSIKMSNEYTTVLPVSVNFSNLPANKSLTEATDTIINIEITERGSELLRLKYFEKDRSATISLKNVRFANVDNYYRGFVTSSLLISQLGHQLDLSDKIKAVYPDTLFILLEQKGYKKLPVTADLDLEFRKQFMLYGNVNFDPDSVMATGPEMILKGLSRASVGKISLKDLDESVTLEKEVIKDSTQQWLTYEPAIVNVTIPVEQFTEAKIELPIEVLRDSSDMKVKLFPESVTVTYIVALKDFDKINPEMFEVAADLRQADLTGENKIRVRVVRKPDFIAISQVEPEKVEFILLQ